MALSKMRETPELIRWFSTLADITRLRMLRLLEMEELGVGEIARIMQLPQSTVSRHLKVLLETGWVAKRHEGTSSLYRVVPDLPDEDARTLWRTARDRLADTASFKSDAERVREVLAERHTDSKAFFGRVGGEWDELRRDLFGDRFTAEALLGLIPPDSVVADIGCGTGQASELLAPHVAKVIAIDREPAMLSAARKRLRGYRNIEFREGDIASLPLRPRECDIALLLLVMHHLEAPQEAIPAVTKALRPGGAIMILDMIEHDREVYRHTMGHRHLGFSEQELRRWAKAASLPHVRIVRLRPDTEGKGPPLFIATMRKAKEQQ